MLTRNVRLTIIGAVIGAALGGVTAWAVAKMQEQKLPAELRSGREVSLTANAQEYIGLAVTLIAVIRQVVSLFKLT